MPPTHIFVVKSRCTIMDIETCEKYSVSSDDTIEEESSTEEDDWQLELNEEQQVFIVNVILNILLA